MVINLCSEPVRGAARAALVLLLAVSVAAGCGGVQTTGATSVYALAMNGDFGEVRAALESGFNVNRPDADGRTLLHFAIAGNQAMLTEMLIVNYGADANLADAAGVRAVDLAIEYGNPEVLEVLYNEGLVHY